MVDIENDASAVSTLLTAGGRMVDISDRVYDDIEDDIPMKLVIRGGGGEEPEVWTELLELREKRAGAPRRRTGRFALTELDSFIAWINRYKEERSVVWSDLDAFTLRAVIDEHAASDEQHIAAWREFSATYTAPRSPEWKAWTEKEGKPLEQDNFADFIEERLEDLTTGEGAAKPTDVLTMARDLRVHTKGTFQRTVNPTTGNFTLTNKTETDTGSTQIPRMFLIAIPVFEGGERYRVEARVRFALENGRPVFGFLLHRRKEIERDAFNACRAAVANSTGLPIFAGKS